MSSSNLDCFHAPLKLDRNEALIFLSSIDEGTLNNSQLQWKSLDSDHSGWEILDLYRRASKGESPQ